MCVPARSIEMLRGRRKCSNECIRNEDRPCKIQQHNESNCVYKIYNDRL